ncbi:MAG: SDR family NAD(P)-dependent oxidoreductase [Acidimicrobiales bacterium]
MSVPFDLSGRVAVVTGGNGGIGLGIAAVLGGAGAAVAVWARNPEKTAEALASLRAAGVDADGFGCDVADEAQVVAAAEATVGRFGRIDVCVANAGVGGHDDLLDTTLADWDRVIRTDLTGSFLCFRECIRDMARRDDGGALVAVSSGAAVHAAPKMASYAAAKAGLGGLVRSLAAELAPRRIRANVLVPGWTASSKQTEASVPDDLRIETVASIPAGRWGLPEDLGTAALYLADPTLAFHTGSELRVDGGYSIMPPYLAARAARRPPPRLDP